METSTSARLKVQDLRIHDVGPVSFDVVAGGCVGISGPSGAGKSLLLRAIADMEPHEGLVFLDGQSQDTTAAPDWRRQVALLPAESVWWFDSVGEHFPAPDTVDFRQMGFDRKILAWPVSRLSSGERQRLALLRLMQNRPGVLLLDEPTANLDEENAARVEQHMQAYRQETGAVIVWVGHQKVQLLRMADRILAIDHGRLIDGGHAP